VFPPRTYWIKQGDVPAYTALTFDTRIGPPLVISIRHMACTLPKDWVIMFIYHYSMRKSVFEFSDLLKSGKLRAWELSTLERTI